MYSAFALPDGRVLVPKRIEAEGLSAEGFVIVDEASTEAQAWKKWTRPATADVLAFVRKTRALGGPGSGDVEGHEFHGNQWTTGGGGGGGGARETNEDDPEDYYGRGLAEVNLVPNGNRTVKVKTVPTTRSPKDIEDYLLKLDDGNEHVIFTPPEDAEESEQIELRGSNMGVQIDDVMSPSMQGQTIMYGTLAHNHPIDLSLSTNDLRYADAFHLREVKAVSKNATYTMRLKRKGAEWPDGFTVALFDAEESVKQDFVKAIKAGKMTAKEAFFKHQDETNRRVAAQFPDQLEYSVTKH
jgi:hypothetical protein